MKLKRTFEFPMYKSNLKILIGTQKELITKIEKDKDFSERDKDDLLNGLSTKSCRGFCKRYSRTRNFLIAVIIDKATEENKRKYLVDTFSHELRHYGDRLLDLLSTQPMYERESIAYLTGYISGEVIPELI